MALEIFDSRGRLRRDLAGSAELDGLPPEKLKSFDALHAAATACESAEAELVSANDTLAAAVKAHATAVEAQRRANPGRSFMDEWRAARDAES